jgi:hypothetical protein
MTTTMQSNTSGILFGDPLWTPSFHTNDDDPWRNSPSNRNRPVPKEMDKTEPPKTASVVVLDMRPTKAPNTNGDRMAKLDEADVDACYDDGMDIHNCDSTCPCHDISDALEDEFDEGFVYETIPVYVCKLCDKIILGETALDMHKMVHLVE